MSDPSTPFAYVAVDDRGRRVRGVIQAASEQAAFAQLKAGGLMPTGVKPAAGREATVNSAGRSKDAGLTLKGRELAAFVADLAALLRAGADIRAALSIVGGKTSEPAVQAAARLIAQEVSGGESVDRALGRRVGDRYAFIAALAAAGEASGDLAGGLERGAEMLTARIAMRDQLVTVLSYPLFVLVTAVAAFLIILTLVVPSLAPLAEAAGSSPPLPMKLLLGASNFVISNGLVLGGLTLAGIVGLVVAASTGQLGRWIDNVFLNGPVKRIAQGLVYGGFSVALGGILSSGASITEALRLALRSVSSKVAQARLQPVVHAVRQGEPLSSALARVEGFPASVARLSLVGEESGALGQMLERAGRLEEQQAMRRVEAGSRILGPLLIVMLGGLIGLLMAALLSGVTGLGESALN